MLKMVAPEASYEERSGHMFQNRDFHVGGKSVSQSWLWSPGISGARLGGLWGISGRSLLRGKGPQEASEGWWLEACRLEAGGWRSWKLEAGSWWRNPWQGTTPQQPPRDQMWEVMGIGTTP